MYLQIDSRWPLVWRSPSTFQCGIDSPRAVITDIDGAEEQLVRLLAHGTRISDLHRLARTQGLSQARVDQILKELSSVLIPPAGHSGDTKTSSHGGSSYRENFRNVNVIIHPESVDNQIMRAVFTAAGAQVSLASSAHSTPREHPFTRTLETPLQSSTTAVSLPLMLICAHFAVRPRLYQQWVHHDTPHVPVVFSDSSVRVGPLVVPGKTACLFCVDLNRRDNEPEWPTIATQLLERKAPTHTAALTSLAASLLVKSVESWVAQGRSELLNQQASISYDTHAISHTRVDTHPLCTCCD
ncbi:TOMM precursor leader peptide-binding protein [Lysinibacter sp. HNR]|uniref:TOMM precursor leader peptide-binding protein n=1 Tax=Lysinibacter sp. HNR TaxID=3031408 RepID=UPI002434D735|nr:TOMM precursor leader peptide-binding protein [Lysinibacter sp. HNR]WGD38380.1 TOMM precursor leader peptide-binding protein [Lysinibacter sp. HNR]